MARPSLKHERRQQIIEALERCVARYGVEGATLERVADEAGLTRSLIRHNVGNRDALLEALVERFLVRSGGRLDELISALPEEERLEVLIAWLFDPQYADSTDVLVAEALIAAGARDERLAETLRGWLDGIVESFGQVIAEAYPEAAAEDVAAVSAGLTGIYFNVESTAPLGPMTALREASQRAALRLVRSLES